MDFKSATKNVALLVIFGSINRERKKFCVNG